MESCSEGRHCLQEASLFMMPSRLRELFASILHESAPACLGNLWDAFKGPLSEDLLHRLWQARDLGSPLMPLIATATVHFQAQFLVTETALMLCS